MSALLISMEKELSKWKTSTILYGTLYVGFRTMLIVFSAIVAAQNNLEGSAAEILVSSVPILALAVTIVTAIDTWQKPQIKWKGFMEDRDFLESLVIRCKSGKEQEEGLLREFEDLRNKHRAEHVF